MKLSVGHGGQGPLLKATVTPFPRENLTPRATWVELANGRVDTGPRLRTRHLVSMDDYNRAVRAAVLDDNGLWSEWSAAQNLSIPKFTYGATNGSIGSGSSSDLSLEEPAVRFPLLNQGSSKLETYRTVVSDGFYDEQRSSRWSQPRVAFTCVLRDLDQQDVLLLHRFYRALNGPLTPFWFDWTDPDTGKEERYLVRFRDPSLADDLFLVDRSNMEFTLVELVKDAQ
jgi:hypothetical protein